MRRVRRQTLGYVAALALAPWRVAAQQPERVYRLGWLGAIAESFSQPQALSFVRRLAEVGLVEGRNLAIERRHADGKADRLSPSAAELARAKCDILFGSGPEDNLAALAQASRDTPIVFIAVDFDPVTSGHVASLAKPGGRITGLAAQQSVLPGKRLELLKQMLPGTRKVAVFANEQTTGQLAMAQQAAKPLGLALHVVNFKRPPFDYEAGFADALRAKADALFVLGSGLWVPARRKLPEQALKAGLPSVFHHSQWVEAGGLLSYGFNFVEMWRRGAEIVAEVLRGVSPAEIPMEEPATYELTVNLKTAKALGLTIAPSFLLRADRVIE